MNLPANLNEARAVQEKDFRRARDQWLHSFDTLLLAMLEPDTSTDRATTRIQQCAELADVALAEIERRWAA